ncbi:DNA-directed RNA polymerase subunit L [Methanomicrobium antiquum]|uniref:DNA-directed RNA polymerase subunit Rpo11 n=1 Tax=Methanomicrobium antiquum TaxID=487686 RepID=A0AAF0FTD4_9EURY|nr:DNA-directed RNA polymerase subunit L [Methanomicrobium antiquum]WFN36188.1 DNA-directed RNA polymerase subunit L [Methanomicrobium antiquum]
MTSKSTNVWLSMEIKILELTEDKARIAFLGENHTYMNTLKEEILKNPDVDVAQYYNEYTFTDPVLLVSTKNKKDPIEAIINAAKAVSSDCANLIELVEKA